MVVRGLINILKMFDPDFEITFVDREGKYIPIDDIDIQELKAFEEVQFALNNIEL